MNAGSSNAKRFAPAARYVPKPVQTSSRKAEHGVVDDDIILVHRHGNGSSHGSKCYIYYGILRVALLPLRSIQVICDLN